MVASTELPKWLPLSAKREAQRILDTEGADTALVLRLATDKRMEEVWKELRKHKPRHPRLSEAWGGLMKGRLDVEPPPPDSDAMTLFFWVAFTIASLEPVAGTVPRTNLPISQYQREAARLRLSAAMLRKLKLQYGEVVQNAVQFADIHANDIEQAADFCDEIVDMLSKIKAFESRLAVTRNYGNPEARGYVIQLSIETKNLFGKQLRGTLATVASVALNKEITREQVRKWLDSLSRKG